MKLNQFVLLGVTSVFVSVLPFSGITVGVSANPSSNAAVAQTRPAATMSGTFVTAEKPTTGMARIVTENGHRYLEFDSAFSTSEQGPDLHVLLDTAQTAPMTYENPGSYVNLGKLQKFSGTQRYPIPDAIDLADFKSVVIWCRMANATFGYASLGGGSNASTR
ncbi:MAG: DM13 domain-containing protein [Coleofasciculus sp. S288]|nr:DM13 domain-containing protein [Coleofasciculus sp. S288]